MYVIFIFHPSSLALKSRNLGAKGVNGCRLARRYRLILFTLLRCSPLHLQGARPVSYCCGLAPTSSSLFGVRKIHEKGYWYKLLKIKSV